MTADIQSRVHADLVAMFENYRHELTAHQFARLVTEFLTFDRAGEVPASSHSVRRPVLTLVRPRSAPPPGPEAA